MRGHIICGARRDCAPTAFSTHERPLPRHDEHDRLRQCFGESAVAPREGGWYDGHDDNKKYMSIVPIVKSREP